MVQSNLTLALLDQGKEPVGMNGGLPQAAAHELLSITREMVAYLLVRSVDDGLVLELEKRAGAHGRSAEEHRTILGAALLTPPRLKLAELLVAMPDVGLDSDFHRPAEPTTAPNAFC